MRAGLSNVLVKMDMTTDILADWKSNKFILVPPLLMPDGLDINYLVILTDINYWANCEDDLRTWCIEHECLVEGMTINFPTEEMLTLFVLRWC